MTTVLVLRPEPGASATAERAARAGITAVKAPLFHVVPVAWQPPDGPIDAIMLTSANAVRHAGPALARYLHLPAHAVGAATAEAARAAGFGEVIAGAGDAATLVATLGARRVLHLAGRDHKPALPSGGVRRIVYAAEARADLPEPARTALAEGAVVLLHSARAGAIFAMLAGERSGIRIAAISADAAAAAGPGWRALAVADRPDDAALLAAAARLCDQGGRDGPRERLDGERE